MLLNIIAIIVIFIWRMAPIVISAIIASKKERNEMLWAFLGLVFGWISVLIIACLSVAQSKKLNNDEDELFKLKKLLDNGVITQEEFDAKKKQILRL